MSYNINQQYPISELSNIERWWFENRNYDINIDEENQTVVIVPRSEQQIKEDRIAVLKAQLEETDYIAAKLSEASAIAELSGNKDFLSEVFTKYNPVITQRRAWREELDSLLK